jgi:heme ABC exporter ATP-binding subunit CcmA
VPVNCPAIELENVSRLFGRFVALRRVSLQIAAGESVVLLGENGAGKSTLLRLVAGLMQPTHGSVRVLGLPPQDQAGSLAYMSHAPMLYDELTGLENLEYFRALASSAAITSAAALERVGLDPALPQRVSEYSQGMRQRASLARVLMLSPQVLLLDEPFSNMDRASAEQMVASLRDFTADGVRTLLLTTHQAELAAPLARTTLVLRRGELVQATDSTAPQAQLPSGPDHQQGRAR